MQKINVSIGTMETTRTGAAAARLAKGGILVSGGKNASGSTLASAEIYRQVYGSGGSRGFAATGNLVTGRSGHTATPLPNGLVLIVGGQDSSGDYLSSAELFDPATGEFTAAAVGLDAGRAGHTATLLSDGSVLIAGGTGSGGALDTAELYVPYTS
jgi:hypothetical protein